jgi:preprotein translocase subunit SecF
MTLKTIPFLSFKVPAVLFSSLLIIGLFAVTFVRGGFNLGIDFKSGLSMVVTLTGDYTEEAVNAVLTDISGSNVRRGEGLNYIISATDNGMADF